MNYYYRTKWNALKHTCDVSRNRLKFKVRHKGIKHSAQSLHNCLNPILAAAFVLMLPTMFAADANAGNIHWDGEIDTDMNTSTNWLGDIEPGVSDRVYIGSSSGITPAIATLNGGGTLTNDYGYIGYNSATTGNVSITNSSNWTLANYLYVGRDGTGALSINNIGTVNSARTYIGNFESSEGTVTVTGLGSTLAASDLLYIGNSGTGTLNIENGGTVTSTNETYIGFAGTGDGTVTVTGADATLDIGGQFYIGYSGNGTLNVENGGAVTSNYGRIGFSTGSVGSATVTGTNSSWTITNYLDIGSDGTGVLTISDGGALSGSDAYVGHYVGSEGTLTVTGAGSNVNVANELYVGERGTGTMNIESGATVSSAEGRIGNDSGTVGTVTVTGENSSWTITNYLDVGRLGTGTLSITNGGEVNSGYGRIGYDTGSIGTVTISGGNSNWSISNDFSIGYIGSGALNIDTAGSVTSDTDAFIGYDNGSTGNVTVTDTNSSWIIGDELFVGRYGTGTLTIEGGASVNTNNHAYLGRYTDSSGEVTITGVGSNWTVTNRLYLGTVGSGILAVENGGTVNNNVGWIGSNAGGNGIATVSGVGSNWTISDELAVGRSGTGSLTITNGGSVSAGVLRIAYLDNSQGTVTVSGPGSSLVAHGGEIGYGANSSSLLTISNGASVATDTGGLYLSGGSVMNVTGSGTSVNIGSASGGSNRWLSIGEASVNVSDGAHIETDGAYVSGNSSGTASMIVTGAGSDLDGRDLIYVGGNGTDNGGDGSLTISSGAVASASVIAVGIDTDTTGTILVTGAGSSLSSVETPYSGKVYVGYNGNGTLTLKENAALSAADVIRIAWENGSTGVLNIGAAENDTATAAGSILSTNGVVFGGGNGALVFNHSNDDYNFDLDISGTGAVSLFAGTTSFGGNLSSNIGTFTTDGGTLAIAEAETLTLGGDYSQTVDGTLQIGASSESSYGKLEVAGVAAFEADSKINIDVASFNTLNPLVVNKTLEDVVTAGTLNASTFTLTDSSALFDFTAIVDENTIDLTIERDITLNDLVTESSLTFGVGAAIQLDGFIKGDSNDLDVDNVVTAIGKLSTRQEVIDAITETLPLFATGTNQLISHTMSGTNRVIQSRQSSLRGLSSGDDLFSDKYTWFKTVGSWGEQDSRKGIGGYDSDTFGFVFGVDGEYNPEQTLGLAFSFSCVDVTGKDYADGNSAIIDNYQFIAYGTQGLTNDWELNWQADVGINDNDSERYISFMSRTAEADYYSYTAHVGTGVATSYVLNKQLTLIPSIRADYAIIHSESYKEKGAGAINLHVDSDQTDELNIMGQLHLSYDIDGNTLSTHIGIGYDLLDSDASLTAAYAGGSSAFVTRGVSSSPWTVRAGMDLQLNLADERQLSFQYDIDDRSDFFSQTASIKYRWLF